MTGLSVQTQLVAITVRVGLDIVVMEPLVPVHSHSLICNTLHLLHMNLCSEFSA